MKRSAGFALAAITLTPSVACSGGGTYSPSSTTAFSADAVQSSRAGAFPRTAAGPNLYVVNYEGNSVSVYAPGKIKPLRTITEDLALPNSLAFDNAGNLYVANQSNNLVTVYAAGHTKLIRKISAKVHDPDALAFDGSGDCTSAITRAVRPLRCTRRGAGT
jgi:DNA-binding beta-propeller fold protein YncE